MDEQRFREYVDAYNRAELATTSEFWADGVDVSLPGDRPSPTGKDEFYAHFETLHDRVEEHIEIENVFASADGRQLAVEFHSTFTAKQDVPAFVYGALAEGEQTTNRAFLHYDIDEDDKFTRIKVAQRDPSPSMAPQE